MSSCCAITWPPALPGCEFRETTFADYLEHLPGHLGEHVMQVGHNTLRLMAMGMEDRAATAGRAVLMQHLLEEALEAGALGLSSGLFTAPGIFAETEELIALGRVLQRYGAAYASHIRDEANHVFEAVREAIAIGEACGIHVQIAHLKLSGTDNWGGAARLLAEIDAARSAVCRSMSISTPTLPVVTPCVTCYRPGSRKAAWRSCSSA